MAWDPLAPRTLAAAIALGGLGTMMLAPAPSWESAGIGLACILAFGTLSLVPAARPDRPRPAARPAPIPVSDAAPWEDAMRQAKPVQALPPPKRLTDPHPIVFKGMRARRSAHQI